MISCLSRHRELISYSPKLFLFTQKISVKSYLFNDAILFGIDRRHVEGSRNSDLQPYQLYLIRGEVTNSESKESEAPKSPTSKDIDTATRSNGVTGKIINATLIDLSKNQRVYTGCCDSVKYCFIDMFTYLYNTLLYIFVGILCCSGDYIVEKNKKHRFPIVF